VPTGTETPGRRPGAAAVHRDPRTHPARAQPRHRCAPVDRDPAPPGGTDVAGGDRHSDRAGGRDPRPRGGVGVARRPVVRRARGQRGRDLGRLPGEPVGFTETLGLSATSRPRWVRHASRRRVLPAEVTRSTSTPDRLVGRLGHLSTSTACPAPRQSRPGTTTSTTCTHRTCSTTGTREPTTSSLRKRLREVGASDNQILRCSPFAHGT
jgi:hypothetical protein